MNRLRIPFYIATDFLQKPDARGHAAGLNR